MRALRLRLLLFCLLVWSSELQAQIAGIGPVGAVVRAQTGFGFTEGPAADRDGNIYFTDLPRNRIHKLDVQGRLSTFLENTGGMNGLMFDGRGRLIACQGTPARVVAIDINTKSIEVIADQFQGQRFEGPNDLAVDRSGGVYFTDFPVGHVYYAAAGGTVTRVISNLSFANGIRLSPDERTLYVLTANVRAYPVNGPGQIGAGSVLANLQSTGGGDGMTVDTQGNLYVTRPSLSALEVVTPLGRSLGLIQFPESPANCAFGGIDLRTLFVTARSSIYTVRMEATGFNPWIRSVSENNFAIADRGGVSWTTVGGSGSLVAGFARVLADAASSTPAGLAIFGLRQGGVLVTEAAVPATSLMTSGRIYAEADRTINTGLAIANPNAEAASVSFHFTDAGGNNFGQGSTIIPANSQSAAFLNERPFNGGASITGTFTFVSSVPVSAVALRGLTNERSEFLITTLPVVALTASIGEMTVFPHFADGGGWTTNLVLVNPTDQALSGTVQFFSQGTSSAPGQPLMLSVDGQAGTGFPYTIAARSARRLRTSGSGGTTQVGSVRVAPSANTATPSGSAIFTFRSAGISVSEAGIPVMRTASSFRLYVEASGNFDTGQSDSVMTGVAIANSAGAASTVTFELTRLDGTATGLIGTATVPANGQVAMFLNQIQGFGSLPLPFQGILRIATTSSTIVAIGLRGRYNERREFLITATPPADESAPPSVTELVFPHFVDGGGYTTQFVLFSGRVMQAVVGSARFLSQIGQPLTLSLR